MRREVSAAIANAAEDVFASQGLHAAHVEQIARRAGVAVGTLYNYYKDRDAILAALLRSRRRALFEALDQAREEVDGRPVREQFRAFVQAHVRFLAQNRTFFRILFEGELSRMQAAYPTATEEHALSFRGFFDRVEGVVQRAVASGALGEGHANLDAWIFGGMLRTLAMRDLRGSLPPTDEDVDHVVDVFLRGAGK